MVDFTLRYCKTRCKNYTEKNRNVFGYFRGFVDTILVSRRCMLKSIASIVGNCISMQPV